jgi:isoamyl acetate esterase
MKHVTCPFRLRPSIVLFGDSITQYGFGCTDSKTGWAGRLAAAYTRRCDVLNRGFSGYNTRHALELLPRIFGGGGSGASNVGGESDAAARKNELLFCTVFFGANDAALPGEPQHVPIDEYGVNLNKIIMGIQKAADDKSVPILLLTPPPVDEAAWASFREIETCDRQNDVTRLYGLKVKDIAQQYENCLVVDTWELLEGNKHTRGQYLSDGLHLNEAGNDKVYEGLMDAMQAKFPDLAPMSVDDGEGRYGSSGISMEEKLWKELC